jgi:hypothetical protein
MNELTHMFWNEHFRGQKREDLSKMKQKVYDWLNEDNFGGLPLYRGVFWIEKTYSGARLPNYILSYVIKWATKKGFTYLYNK